MGVIRSFLSAIFLIGLSASLAQANERYAAFVVDTQSQDVLHARHADAPRYPASLTKMMTLYKLFEAIEAGEVELDDTMLTSPEAASRPASHLALEAGDRISVDAAIKALIVKSANDVAVVVAEHLAGSESTFAESMTETAHRLGMSRTTFKNASGLPDREQVTTARDLAKLAFALHRDFPQYYSYFALERFRWQGQTYRTHHGLLGRVEGVDGLKTGYIRASGFNIAVSAERDEQSLIAIVMGGRSGATRDAHARALVESAFTALEGRAQGHRLAAHNVPRLNPAREEERLTAELIGLTGPREVGSAATGGLVEIETETDSLLDVPDMGSEPHWVLQVGAYGTQAAAQARLESIRPMVQGLNNADIETVALNRNGRTLWRARFIGLKSDEARTMCARLAQRGEACFAVAQES